MSVAISWANKWNWPSVTIRLVSNIQSHMCVYVYVCVYVCICVYGIGIKELLNFKRLIANNEPRASKRRLLRLTITVWEYPRLYWLHVITVSIYF